ncbi:hypothetical protein [Mucilaginibacter paludis]|uniref:Uncharacterized protein n=1 Tax=Mucilaginibacter paludis DSM 18603 TaxID=714943 RepID=H1YAX4_9SPHI|nr:hypothetical protein [Mucilaginibacter paludis]EHQ30007.1 hypothetical protein Mucpa_5947 [Mucilaginibacter paludis DSM 18603]
MKKLIYLLLLLPLLSLGQVKPDFVRTPNGGNTIVDWNVKFKTLILPKWAPGAPPLYQGRDTIGGVFVSTNPADKHVYVKQNDGNYTAIANLNDIVAIDSAKYITITHFNTATGISTQSLLNLKANVADSISKWVTKTQLNAAVNLKANNSNTVTVNGSSQTLGSNPSFTTVSSITPGIGFTNNTPITTSGTLNVDTVSAIATKYYASIASPKIPGGAISSIPAIGDNPGTNLTSSAWIISEFYKSKVPTATLTGGSLSEYSTASKTHNLAWSYGRQDVTQPIASAVINPGSFNVFGTQPAAPGTVSGSQSVTTSANTNTTYTITVNTTDSKTATATTTDTWAPGIYYGRCAGTAPTQAEVLAVAGGAKSIATGHAGTWVVTASGSNHPFIAINSTQGNITLIKDVNNFDVTSSFPSSSVSVTNVNGYTATYTTYTLTTATSATYTFTTN